MSMKNLTILSLLLLVLVPSASAQKLKIDPEHRYLLLATKKTSTRQKELNAAAAHGFRIAVGSPKQPVVQRWRCFSNALRSRKMLTPIGSSRQPGPARCRRS